jgi:hypothetical protein
MGLIASSSSGGEFEVVPIGTHRAICYKLADAGTRDEKFKDEDAKKRHTIFIFFELPDLRTSQGPTVQHLQAVHIIFERELCAAQRLEVLAW